MTIAITSTCPFCGKISFIEVNADAYESWRYGDVLIQDAFPELSANDREQLKTGICPECWDNMFSSDNEEEEDYYYEDDNHRCENEDYYYEDDVDECGFNPYMGCYDFDC